MDLLRQLCMLLVYLRDGSAERPSNMLVYLRDGSAERPSNMWVYLRDGSAERPSNMLVYLRDGSAQTVVHAATLRSFRSIFLYDLSHTVTVH